MDRSAERKLIWIAVSLISLIAFEVMAVANAMPNVVADLANDNFYAVTVGVVLATQLMTTAVAGTWCDRSGPLTCLYTGVITLVIALIGCALAPSIYFFITARAIQGLGGGLCVVPIYVLIGNNIDPAHQPRAFSYLAAAWVLPSIIGPAFAGLIVEHLSWRYVFGLVPFLIVPLILILPTALKSVPKTPGRPEVRFSPVTIICALTAGACLAGAQTISGTTDFGWVHGVGVVVILLVLGVVLRPLFPKGTLVLSRGLPATVALRGLVNGGALGLEAYLPLMLRRVWEWSATQAGWILAVGSASWAIGSWIQGKIVSEKRRAKIPYVGVTFLLVGILLALVPLWTPMHPLFLMFAWFVAAFGGGMTYPAMTVYALALTPPEKHGETSSALTISDTVGNALAIALAGCVFVILGGLIPSFTGVIATLVVIVLIAILAARRVTAPSTPTLDTL